MEHAYLYKHLLKLIDFLLDKLIWFALEVHIEIGLHNWYYLLLYELIFKIFFLEFSEKLIDTKRSRRRAEPQGWSALTYSSRWRYSLMILFILVIMVG
jgi:hypothetical protein